MAEQESLFYRSPPDTPPQDMGNTVCDASFQLRDLEELIARTKAAVNQIKEGLRAYP